MRKGITKLSLRKDALEDLRLIACELAMPRLLGRTLPPRREQSHTMLRNYSNLLIMCSLEEKRALDSCRKYISARQRGPESRAFLET